MVRSHIIPQHYLSHFADGRGRLKVYEKDKLPRLGTPKNEAAENGYFAYQKKSGDTDESMEEILARIEGEGSTALRLLANPCYVLFNADKLKLARYIAMLFCRTRARKNASETIGNRLCEATRRIAKNDDVVTNLAQHYTRLVGSEVTPQSVRGSIERVLADAQSPTGSRNYFIQTLLFTAGKILPQIQDKNWQVWLTREPNLFITSDNPVMTMKQTETGVFSPGWGFSNPGVVTVFPVAATACLAIGAEGPPSRYIPTRYVRETNKLVAMCMHRRVYANPHSDEGEVQFLVDSCGGQIRYLENAFVSSRADEDYDKMAEDLILGRD